MFSDIYESIHADDLGSTIGVFHGEPIRSWDPKASKLRDDRLVRDAILLRKAKELPGEGVLSDETTADLASGQFVIRKDNLMRRKTTAESIGYDKFHDGKVDTTGRRMTIEEAVKLSADGAYIIWRPDGVCDPAKAYALVVGEEEGMDPVMGIDDPLVIQGVYNVDAATQQ